jgi:hypothetical protein
MPKILLAATNPASSALSIRIQHDDTEYGPSIQTHEKRPSEKTSKRLFDNSIIALIGLRLEQLL